jgi:hypothetical protein
MGSNNSHNKKKDDIPYNLKSDKFKLQIKSSKATNQLIGCRTGNHGDASFAAVTHLDRDSKDKYIDWILATVETGEKSEPVVICTSIDTDGYHWSVGDNGMQLAKNTTGFYTQKNNWFIFKGKGQSLIAPRKSSNYVCFDFQKGFCSLNGKAQEKFEFTRKKL